MTMTAKNSLPGPENILRRAFPNGITLLVRENLYSATAAIKGAIPCGAYLESSDKLGLTGFLTGCLAAGTTERNFEEIHSLLEESGASLGFNVGSRSIGFSGSCLSEDLRRPFDQLSKYIFSNSHFVFYPLFSLPAFLLLLR